MIFIKGNVPSSKNSKKPVTLPGRNYTTLVHSDAVKKYLQNIGVKSYSAKGVEFYATKPNLFKKAVGDYFKDVKYPVIVKFFFVRDSKRKFDFHNAVQIIADLLTAHGYIKDDDMSHFIPVPMRIDGEWYRVDKEGAGVWLKIVEGKYKNENS